MSSAISIESEPGLESRPTTRQQPDTAFHVWHFFVLLSLLAATVAVVVMKQGRPEVLIMVSLTIGAAGATAFAFYRTLAPLTTKDAELTSEPLSARLRAALEREKALTLRSIKELEFDRAMGKLSTPDFDEMAARLRARAIGIMKQLDADRSPYRAVIEKEVAARLAAAPDLKVRPTPAAPDLSAAAEASAGSRRSLGEGGNVRSTSAAPACGCGTVNDHDARFCKSCGAKLGTATERRE